MSNPIKSAEMAPVLQSMQDYICNHFTDELMDEVSSAVSLGLVEDLDIDAEGGKPGVQRNESKIIRTEFWRLDCTKLLADIKMRVKIGVSRDHGIPHYVVRYVNFSAQFTLDGGITLHASCPSYPNIWCRCSPTMRWRSWYCSFCANTGANKPY